MRLLLFFCFLSCLSVKETSKLTTSQNKTVKISRDSQQIAHIDAQTLNGALYGLGYVQAKDRLFQMQ
jgi:acyl-homoserine lactone acylase PvdQ